MTNKLSIISCVACALWMEREMKIHSFTNMNNEQEHFHLWINDIESISPTFITQFSLLKCIETTTMGCYARKILMHSLAVSQIAHTRPFFFPFFFSFLVFPYFAVHRHIHKISVTLRLWFYVIIIRGEHWALSIEHDHQHFPKITFHINEASFSLYCCCCCCGSLVCHLFFMCYLRVSVLFAFILNVKRKVKTEMKRFKLATDWTGKNNWNVTLFAMWMLSTLYLQWI